MDHSAAERPLPSSPWQPAAAGWCRRTGCPQDWPDLFAAEQPDAVTIAAFEAWALRRLAQTWAGEGDSRIGGDLAAFLVQQHLGRSARRLAYRQRLSAEEWDDLLADAAVTALRVFAERPIDNPRGYLYRTLQRAIWDYVRKAGRESCYDEVPPVADPAPNPEETAHWRAMLARVQACCADQLSTEDQVIFEGLILGGHTAAEVGRKVGLTANAINVRKHRIRKRLQAVLSEDLAFAA